MPLKTLSRFLALFLLGFGAARAVAAGEEIKSLRLYALDGGIVSSKDMGFLSDTGDYNGKPGTFADPVFVIRHPKGTLVWDTGIGDRMAEAGAKGVDDPASGAHIVVASTLVDQLRVIGLAPADVTYVAFSHFHFDHTGNANLFGSATWILNKAELAWAQTDPGLFVNMDTISAYRTAKTEMIDGDYDVFGDGSVRILKTPGHTPGHQSLEVKLKKSMLLLSGDLYHQEQSRKLRLVPLFNTERADTLASIDRFERIANNTKARVVVQHDLQDFKALPKAPAYLE